MIYKEWIKIRWILIGSVIAGLLVVAYMFMNIQRSITFSGANNVWYGILFMNDQFFRLMKYIPLLIGIGIGVSQYFPETVSKRIKLTFHLPINENKALLLMLGFGVLSILTTFALHFVVYWILSNYYFGSEITIATLISITPWFLSGLTAYFMVALIVLEPIWKFRILYTAAALMFVPLYLKSGMIGAYATINVQLALLTLLISVSLLFSAYRFRKGEM